MNRAVLYLRELKGKILGEKLSAERVAAGWSLGMFIGCFIPFGMQLIISIPLSVAFRVSRIGATVGTLITNPVTIFFIYPVQIWVGSRLIGCPLTWEYLREGVVERLAEASIWSAEGWHILAGLSGRVLGGFFAGGFLLAAIMTPITYFVVKGIIVQARRLRSNYKKRGEVSNEN